MLLALGLTAITASTAQQVQIDGIRPREFRGVNPIKGKGYYTYYVNEKSGKGMIDFALEIYDLDLNVIKKTNIQVTKNSEVVGSEFNGNDFMFVFKLVFVFVFKLMFTKQTAEDRTQFVFVFVFMLEFIFELVFLLELVFVFKFMLEFVFKFMFKLVFKLMRFVHFQHGSSDVMHCDCF